MWANWEARCPRADSKPANSGVGRSDERTGHTERENRAERDGNDPEKERSEGKGTEHRDRGASAEQHSIV